MPGNTRIPSLPMAAPDNMAHRILVVDDEPAVADSIGQILSMDQYQVQIVPGGHEALNALRQGKFDLVIVDYEMPIMKGDKLAAAIKELAPQQPIMMMTAYGEALRFAGDFPLTVDAVINKPFALDEFRDTVRKLVASR